MTQEIHVRGLAELNRALEQLPVKIERNILRGALRAGAKVQLDEARRLVPVAPPNEENARLYGGRPGALRDSLRISVRARGSVVTAQVKAGGKRSGTDTYYAPWVEKGTKPHDIKPRARKSLFFAGLLREVVRHPGAAPKPFMRPALERTTQRVLATIVAYIRRRLTKAGIETPGP